MVKKILQTTAWLLLLTIAGLSLVSPWYRPMTNIPHALEHFAIFFATGLAFGLGYSSPYLYRLIPLIGFTAAVEIAQLWAPGRHARLSDFLINVLAVSIGLAWVSAQDRFFESRSINGQKQRRADSTQVVVNPRRIHSTGSGHTTTNDRCGDSGQ
jgi:VanZ family protein